MIRKLPQKNRPSIQVQNAGMNNVDSFRQTRIRKRAKYLRKQAEHTLGGMKYS